MRFWIVVMMCLLFVTTQSLAQEPAPTDGGHNEAKEPSVTYDVLQTGQDSEEDNAETPDEELDEEKEGYTIYDVLQTDQSSDEETAADDGGQSNEEEPIPVPIKAGEDDEIKTIGGQSLVDDVFMSERNHFGFSLSGYLANSRRLSNRNSYEGSGTITAFMPKAFFNTGNRKSRFHLNFGAGYRHYHQNSQFDSWDYSASSNYTYRISRSSSFGVSDQFHSAYNDAWSFLSIYSPIYYDPSFSDEVVFNRQRITRNSLTGSYYQKIGEGGRFRIFAGHRLYLYSSDTAVDTNTFQVGATFNYGYNWRWKWLSLQTGYKMGIINDRFSDRRVHDLQLLGLDFRLGRSWRAWVHGGGSFTNSAGVFSDRPDTFHLRPTGDAGIGYTSLDCDFSVTYQRQFTAAIGLSRLLLSDILSARFGYRLTNRINSNLESHYYRSSELERGGTLETFSAGGGLQFGLTQNLIASLNAAYQDQISHRFSVPGLDITRFSAYAGLHFVWPSRRGTG